MVLPKMGTPQHEEFMRRAAKDPNSMEANVLRQMVSDTQDHAQTQVRSMLQSMIELVPGQLFRDIGRFHAKFGLEPTNEDSHELPADLLAFRIRFMLEELQEYAQAVGHPLTHFDNVGHTTTLNTGTFDAEKAFDGLIDLVYVALGTAFLHRFPFNEGWDRVQEANIAKERATGADDARSTRKHSADIVKPAGWKPPVLKDLLGPYKDAHALLKNHAHVTVAIVVETVKDAVITQREFDDPRCKVVPKNDAMTGLCFDVALVNCKADHELIQHLRLRLNPGGKIVLMKGTSDEAPKASDSGLD